ATATPATRQTRRLENRCDNRPPNGIATKDPTPRQTSTQPDGLQVRLKVVADRRDPGEPGPRDQAEQAEADEGRDQVAAGPRVHAPSVRHHRARYQPGPTAGARPPRSSTAFGAPIRRSTDLASGDRTRPVPSMI